MSAREAFKQIVKGVNIMTPEIIRYGFLDGGRYLFELSEGRGIEGEKVYGVTVLVKDGSKYIRDSASKCCHSLGEVNALLEDLDSV